MNLFYVASKTLQYLLDPVLYLFFLALLGVVLIKMNRVFRICCGVLLFCLYLLSTKLVSNKLWQSLEHLVPAVALEEHYDAAIVLGGIMDRDYHNHRSMMFADSVERILEPIKLYHDKKINFIVLSSGVPVEALPEDKESEKLKKFAIGWGVPAERIITDTQSHNTYQNALESKLIIEKMGFKKILLVTSAFHMKRGLGCFEKLGLSLTPYPVDYSCDDVGFRLTNLIPESQNLNMSARAIHERIGLVMYRIVGYTN